MTSPPDHLQDALQAPQKDTFDDDHAVDRPIQIYFQESHEGPVLFLIFYTAACRWRRCTGCPLPHTSSSRPVGLRPLIQQIDHVFAQPAVLERRLEIRKVIISNQGSMLDEETFSSLALMYLIIQLKLLLPKVERVCLESRAEYVDAEELEFLARGLAEGDTRATLEIGIGFEAFDPRIRNREFHKGLTLGAFEELAGKLQRHDFHLKCYFMQKPVPGLSDEDAVADIQAAIGYLADLAEARGAHISMHLNPTYAAVGTPLGQAFREGRFTPPHLRDVARAALAARGRRLPIFIGLWDEGLAEPGGSFLRPGEEDLVATLERFNRSQDFALLEAVVA